ncbi:hypothetical protein JFT91_23755 [Pseudomonas sp. TH08]|uniref:DUF6124 family protein n=1 Tax=unclassified Pseudomonas TaxID=196821 RepID=UPI00191496DE|nr:MULTISPECIES: hypothetical protein [unclassified Pseudomonas]MBK5525832.1 hypothetical protein [Pseudomonas sp. TH06]MBK5535554.1 hypothetical protein [Pseudomonas sp. TH08]
MKKITRLSLVGAASADAQTPGQQSPASATGRNRRRTIPLKQMFSVRDDVDTITLLSHASDLLDSLTQISANFADECEGSQRHIAVAIRQLSALAEIVVCRARDQVVQQGSPAPSGPEVRH